MRKIEIRAAVAAALLSVLFTSSSQAQYSRRNAIVEAVEKTSAAIVSVKVVKERGYGSSDIDGSGVVVDERGYMVTNYHVIRGGSRIAVVFTDKTRVEAQVFASVPSRDLAILKLPAKRKYKALAFAPGTDLKVGETVIAVGNPYGFDHTVTTGIISALGREIGVRGDDRLPNVIQHSAPINPGNSGGPLLNINGEMIGINLALREGAQNLSFALNAETVKDVLSRYLSSSRVAGVAHGLSCVDQATSECGNGRQKVVVEKVSDSGPAARAGLRSGDMIVQVEGTPVENRFDLERVLWTRKAGESVKVLVVRDGKQTALSLQLASTGTDRVTSVSNPADDE